MISLRIIARPLSKDGAVAAPGARARHDSAVLHRLRPEAETAYFLRMAFIFFIAFIAFMAIIAFILRIFIGAASSAAFMAFIRRIAFMAFMAFIAFMRIALAIAAGSEQRRKKTCLSFAKLEPK